MSLLARYRAAGLLLAATIFLLDQWIKRLVIHVWKLHETNAAIEVLPFFDLRFVPNFGVSLGMLTADTVEARWMLVAMTSLIALIVLVWMLREKVLGDILALGLILGGALGNIRDRALRGHVIDYADLHFGEFRPFLVFNLADAAITIGVVIILARSLLSREKPAQPAEAASESSTNAS